MKKLNLINQTFGNWTVLTEDKVIVDRGRTYWYCRCICGVERGVAGTSLTKGISTSCGCAGGQRKSTVNASDYIGRKFGRLLVVSITDDIIDDEGKYRIAYLCNCDCGKEAIVRRHGLQNPNGPRSCGCLAFDTRSALGLSKRLYEPHIATARAIFQFRYSDGDLTFDDFYDLSQKHCHYCGTAPNTTYNKFIHRGEAKNSQHAMDNGNFTYNGLDRIDSSLPHNKDNVVSCCIMCNAAKSDHNQDEWGEWVCTVYNNWANKFNK